MSSVILWALEPSKSMSAWSSDPLGNNQIISNPFPVNDFQISVNDFRVHLRKWDWSFLLTQRIDSHFIQFVPQTF